jgi:hypothetical protein
MSERELICTRGCAPSCYNLAKASVLPFTKVSEVFLRNHYLSCLGDPKYVFLLMYVNNHFGNPTAAIWKMWKATPSPSLNLRHNGNYTSGAGFVSAQVDVALLL